MLAVKRDTRDQVMTPKRITGVKCFCDDGSIFYWSSPTRWERWLNGSRVDSSRRAGGMTTAEAHAFCEAHETHQALNVEWAA